MLHKRLRGPLHSVFLPFCRPEEVSRPSSCPPRSWPPLSVRSFSRLSAASSLLGCLLVQRLPPPRSTGAGGGDDAGSVVPSGARLCRSWSGAASGVLELGRGRRRAFCCLRSLRYGPSAVFFLRLLLMKSIYRDVSDILIFPLSSFSFDFFSFGFFYRCAGGACRFSSPLAR
jgi:hypothetical protein